VAVGVKADSGAYAVAKTVKAFALNMLGKDQQGAAFAFFKPVEQDGDTINGERFHTGEIVSPILENMPAAAECKLLEIVEGGDHHIFVGEIVAVRQRKMHEGRPDDAILHMKEMGGNVFYGG